MLALISFTLFTFYLIWIIKTFGVPDSFSDTYYLLNEKKPRLGSLFTLLMMSMSFLMISVMMDYTPENFKFLGFLTLCGILFVGGAPAFLDKTESKVHFFAAGVAAICSLTWLFICFPQYVWILGINLGILLIPLIRSIKIKWGFLFWAEMVLFFTIFTVLIIVSFSPK
jgi:hypothetical protein